MILEEIIRRLRERCPSFQNRVAGAANASQWEAARAAHAPYAIVFPMGTRLVTDEARKSQLGAIRVEHLWQVQVISSGLGDERNQKAAQNWEPLRDEIVGALLAWQPSRGAGRMEFKTAEPGEQTREYSLWSINWGFSELWSPCPTEDQALHDAERFAPSPIGRLGPGKISVVVEAIPCPVEEPCPS